MFEAMLLMMLAQTKRVCGAIAGGRIQGETSWRWLAGAWWTREKK